MSNGNPLPLLACLLLSCSVNAACSGGSSAPEELEDTTSAANSPSGDPLFDAEFAVGVVTADITPTADELSAGNIFLGGYGFLSSRGAAQGVHDPIYARAMVVTSGDVSVAMVVLDVPGMGNRVIHEMELGVVDATGLDRDAVWVGATHTHAGPDFQGLWGGVSESYRARVISATVDAVAEAYEARQPATLHVAASEHDARNRRDWDMTDRELTVLDALAEDGERIGTLIQFAAHPVKLGADNRDVSRDYPGYLVDHAEDVLGAPVLFFNGIMGDCTPGGLGGSDFEGAETYGKSVADAALAALDDTVQVDPGLEVALTRWTAPMENDRFETAFRLGILDYEADDTIGATAIDTQAGYLRLGEQVQGVAFPGESLTRNGMPIKDAMKTPYRMFLGLTTDTLGYFVPSDEWQKGRNDDYEESVSLGRSAGDTARDELVALIETDNVNF